MESGNLKIIFLIFIFTISACGKNQPIVNKIISKEEIKMEIKKPEEKIENEITENKIVEEKIVDNKIEEIQCELKPEKIEMIIINETAEIQQEKMEEKIKEETKEEEEKEANDDNEEDYYKSKKKQINMKWIFWTTLIIAESVYMARWLLNDISPLGTWEW